METKNNIIGYKGTPNERLEDWRGMLAVRKSFKYLKDKPDEKLRAIAEDDRGTYKREVKRYVAAA